MSRKSALLIVLGMIAAPVAAPSQVHAMQPSELPHVSSLIIPVPQIDHVQKHLPISYQHAAIPVIAMSGNDDGCDSGNSSTKPGRPVRPTRPRPGSSIA